MLIDMKKQHRTADHHHAEKTNPPTKTKAHNFLPGTLFTPAFEFVLPSPP
jgi:hypothetical protein